MIRDAIWKRLTGTPWTTTRSMAAEYGPTLATRYPELQRYTDVELVAFGHAILAEVRAPKPAGAVR